MNRWNEIASFLKNNIPFCFSKMNDGELSSILKHDTPISRGYQSPNLELSEKLKEALQYKAHNYFVGLPCKFCYSGHYQMAMMLTADEKYNDNVFYPANILINSNYIKTKNLLEEILPNKNVIVVVNESANTSNLPFNPKFVIKVPESNSWDVFNNIKPLNLLFNDGDVVLLLCGPLGRVLCYEWYKANNKITFIELGSFYDNLTNNKAYMYHTGTVPLCQYCNPEFVIDPYMETIVDNCFCERYFYISTNIYGNDERLLKKVYKIWKSRPENYDKKYEYDIAYNQLDIKISGYNTEKIVNLFNYFLQEYPNKGDYCYSLTEKIEDINLRVDCLKQLLKTPDVNNNWKILNDLVINCYYQNKIHESYLFWIKLKNKINDLQLDQNIINVINENEKYFSFDHTDNYLIFRAQIDNVDYPKNSLTPIPKIFHFIYIFGGHEFMMAHYIAIRSCYELHNPDKIYFYTDGDDLNNEWLQKLKSFVQIVRVRIPSHINNKYIFCKQHQADVMRLYILKKAGGTYMDIDILSLKPLDGQISVNMEKKGDQNLYNNKFVICKEATDKYCNCFIMSVRDHPIFDCWLDAYEKHYGMVDDYWAGLSVRKPYELITEDKDDKYGSVVLSQKVVLPFLFHDFSFFHKDISSDLENSLTVHLWDTEALKYNLVPKNIKYFEENPNNTFTKLFKKYIL